MTDALLPASEEQMLDLLRWAVAEKQALNVHGHGTLAEFGYAPSASTAVSTRHLAGILDYQPEELVMSVRAGTTRAEVEAALSARHQHLPFEPPCFGAAPAPGGAPGTIGGVFASNLSGPRRLVCGAARDYLLGVRGVNGRGELWNCGGRVIKNVTGYDLSKLMAGSWGTLSIATELTFKVLPAPPASASLLVHEPDAFGAAALLSRLAGHPARPTGLAYLPAAAFDRLDAAGGRPRSEGACVVRVEGSSTSVRQRLRDLRAVLRAGTHIETVDDVESRAWWTAIRDLQALHGIPVVLRVSLPPFTAREIVNEWAVPGPRVWFADAAAGCLWLGVDTESAAALVAGLRRRLYGIGSVVVFRAPDPLKRQIGVFSPAPGASTALMRRIRESFDPERILNRGRLEAI